MAIQDHFVSPDYYALDELLSEEHLLIRKTIRDFVKKEISPIIEDVCQSCTFPKALLPKLGALGCFGSFIPTLYGGAELDQISYGLIMQELERGDSGIRSTASVQSSLVMYPIYQYGSDSQKSKYLKKLATGEKIGCLVEFDKNVALDTVVNLIDQCQQIRSNEKNTPETKIIKN